MRYLVAVVALAVLAASAFGVVAPRQLISVVVGWPPATRFSIAVGTRLVLGGVLLAAAPSCRLPGVVRALGIIALAAAASLLFLGAARVDAMIDWWSRRPLVAVRLWCAVGAGIGALLLYAAEEPRAR
jgi:hypothetical protein